MNEASELEDLKPRMTWRHQGLGHNITVFS